MEEKQVQGAIGLLHKYVSEVWSSQSKHEFNDWGVTQLGKLAVNATNDGRVFITFCVDDDVLGVELYEGARKAKAKQLRDQADELDNKREEVL